MGSSKEMASNNITPNRSNTKAASRFSNAYNNSLNRSKTLNNRVKSLNNLQRTPPTKSLSSKKYASLDNIRSLSNSKEFSKYMVQYHPAGLNITVVPQRTYLHQGTHMQFSNAKSKAENIQTFYADYDKRHNGAYFVSSQKVASLYGLNRDFTNIVYTTIPSSDEIRKPKNTYEYIYPLYYIPGMRGTNIKYKLKKDLFLIDIGDIQNIQFIWRLIDGQPISGDAKQEYKDILFETCAQYEKQLGYDKPPQKCKRTSADSSDDELVNIFLSFLIPTIREKYNIYIDGWIYFNTEHFHEEILLSSNKYLDFQSTSTMKPTTYEHIPTIDEFKKSLDSLKIFNSKSIPYNTILSNFCTIRPP
jgi:hypothetical protein